ncbi:MAG: UxaA family hydrolase [Rhodobacteraceae bacterium]|nr:UxaA family hydrolase [Paracoccaceae bacterium]
MINGYLRQDGRKGIRNHISVVYLVECARFVADEIVVPHREAGAQVIGFPGCFPNEYAQKMLERLGTHPNVGAVLLVSLGCESFNRFALEKVIKASGRPVKSIVIQKTGGTASAIQIGRDWVAQQVNHLAKTPRVEMGMDELIIGTICGGSDATSGITGNPAVGLAFDRLGAEGAACIFEETGELIGCEQIMAARAATPELAIELRASVEKAAMYYDTLGFGSFAAGNAEGGLSTIEEKSMGAYAKSGSAEIVGLIKPGDVPPTGGLYLMDVVPDGEVRYGFPNISDNAEIVEMMASGAHMTLFVTGRGSVVGSAIAPVIKICANPETFARLSEDMDINAGRILSGTSLADVAQEIYEHVVSVANGAETKSEALGHAEFILTYKSFDPIGPACLPA